MKFEQESVNGIFCFFSLIHQNDECAADILKKCCRYIKAGGHLLLGLQEGDNDLLIESPLLSGKKMYMNLYSENKIQNMLRKTGFTVRSFLRKSPVSDKQLPFNKLYVLASK